MYETLLKDVFSEKQKDKIVVGKQREFPSMSKSCDVKESEGEREKRERETNF
jgi:hypothetical protein